MMKAGREPEVMAVDLRSCDGEEVHLENDGMVTLRHVEVVEVVSLLQTRSAFRGFVSAMVDLMGWKLVRAYEVEREGE